ncbi:hypothetical protein E3N88_42977 [Mikania micrantha]|uniref:Uncharacterized protein n=1 Tax=Mikania micrantha TaxID=192012 RepID=A0A5N6LG62_9ASTR|nr:hypothetical protein E3N88_42977 [Mikania micrantha]
MNHKGNSLNHSSDACLVMRYIGNCLVSLVWKLMWARVPVLGYVKEESYLVDPASSHMLVSKIKPCMYKRSTRALPVATMIHDNSTDRTALVPATHHSNFCPINFRWDSRGHSYFIVRGEHSWIYERRTTAKAFAKDVFINQERKLGARRRSDTVLVSTINDADQGSADVAFRTPLAPYEKSKFLGSGGSMVARLKLKGIDGRAPPGVEPAA